MKESTLEIEEIKFRIFEYVDNESPQLLYESKNKGRPLVGKYTIDIHQPHNPTGEIHFHLKDKGKEILSMNKSGTAHDGYHGVRIPNKAFKALITKFPDWKWPKDQVIESLQYAYFINKLSNEYYRPVQISSHKFNGINVDPFFGFFHQFAEDPFLTGGSGGWKERTVGLVETEDGQIKKVAVDSIKFLDV